MTTWGDQTCQRFEATAVGFETGLSRLRVRLSNRYAIAPHVYTHIGICVYTYIIFICERILPEYHIRDVWLPNSMARPIKLRFAFNQISLVNHWRDSLICSFKWLCFNNSYIYILLFRFIQTTFV